MPCLFAEVTSMARPLPLRAKKEGISPQEIVDKYHNMLRDGMAGLGINFDVYHRTSSDLHHQSASEFFTTLNDKEAFEIRESEQFYDEEHQQFLADRYIKGECPKCGHPDAYGDQCENCGSALSPQELINPSSTLSGATPILRKTSHWYLPMQHHEDWLRNFLKEGELDGRPHHDPKEWEKPRAWPMHELGGWRFATPRHDTRFRLGSKSSS